MSKLQLKKALKAMDKESIIELVSDLYSARKEAQEYLDYYLEPNENAKIEEYKKIIENEFYPQRKTQEPKLRFSVCRKAISDFKKLKPSSEKLADLMVFYMENACQFTSDFGDMWEQYYTSVETNFEKTVKFVMEQNLLPLFRDRLLRCVKWSMNCGWGFCDTIPDLYCEYTGEDVD